MVSPISILIRRSGQQPLRLVENHIWSRLASRHSVPGECALGQREPARGYCIRLTVSVYWHSDGLDPLHS